MTNGEDDGKRGAQKGCDGGKKIAGRKRHIVVDTTGLLIRAVVHSAEIRDADGAEMVFGKVKEISERLKKIRADMAYRGERLRQWILANTDWELEIVQKPRRSRLVSGGCRTAIDAAFHGSQTKMGGRANLCLARSVSATLERLRISAKEQRNDDLSGDEQFNVEAIGKQNSVRSTKSAKAETKALRKHFLNSL